MARFSGRWSQVTARSSPCREGRRDRVVDHRARPLLSAGGRCEESVDVRGTTASTDITDAELLAVTRSIVVLGSSSRIAEESSDAGRDRDSLASRPCRPAGRLNRCQCLDRRGFTRASDGRILDGEIENVLRRQVYLETASSSVRELQMDLERRRRLEGLGTVGTEHLEHGAGRLSRVESTVRWNSTRRVAMRLMPHLSRSESGRRSRLEFRSSAIKGGSWCIHRETSPGDAGRHGRGETLKPLAGLHRPCLHR